MYLNADYSAPPPPGPPGISSPAATLLKRWMSGIPSEQFEPPPPAPPSYPPAPCIPPARLRTHPITQAGTTAPLLIHFQSVLLPEHRCGESFRPFSLRPVAGHLCGLQGSQGVVDAARNPGSWRPRPQQGAICRSAP